MSAGDIHTRDSDKRIADIEQQLSRMTQERDDWEGRYKALFTDGPLHRLEQELTTLREGIKEHSQCFNADEGDPHDLALWSLLQEVVDE